MKRKEIDWHSFNRTLMYRDGRVVGQLIERENKMQNLDYLKEVKNYFEWKNDYQLMCVST